MPAISIVMLAAVQTIKIGGGVHGTTSCFDSERRLHNQRTTIAPVITVGVKRRRRLLSRPRIMR